MLMNILGGTPVWVWGLLAALVALGLSQSVTRRVSARRAAILPAAMVMLSAGGVLTTFGVRPLALAAWAAGLALAIRFGQDAVTPRGTRWLQEAARFELPGSWLPMGLILAIFCVKYGVGVSLAFTPTLASNAGFEFAVALSYGVFSGLFAARAVALRRLAARA